MDQLTANQNALQQSLHPDDRQTSTKTVYDVSASEVFLKNFLAGFGRALGGVVIYLIFILISAYAFTTYAYPQIKPFIDEYRQAVQSLNQINHLPTTMPGSAPANQQQYQQFLRDLQQSLPQ